MVIDIDTSPLYLFSVILCQGLSNFNNAHQNSSKMKRVNFKENGIQFLHFFISVTISNVYLSILASLSAHLFFIVLEDSVFAFFVVFHSQSWTWQSMAAIFRQSARYVQRYLCRIICIFDFQKSSKLKSLNSVDCSLELVLLFFFTSLNKNLVGFNKNGWF